MKNKKKNRVLWMQLLILAVFILALVVVSALTYDEGIIKEKAFLSLDEASPDYYGTRLNAEDVSFSSMVGSGTEEIASELFPNADTNTVTSWEDMTMRVSYGKDNAFFTTGGDVDWILQTMPTIYCLPDPVSSLDYSFCTATTEEGAELKSQLNEYIEKASGNGEAAEMYAKWVEDYDETDEYYELRPDELSYSGPELQIAAYYDWPPYSFVSDAEGGVGGYFIELMDHFCHEYGYRPVYTTLNSMDSSVMGLNNGIYDVLADGQIYTEERAEELNFTDTVVSEDVYVMVRASEVEGIDVHSYVKGSGFFSYIKDSLYKNLVQNDRWKMLAEGLKNTLLLSIFSLLLGTLLGICIYFLKSRRNLFLSAFGSLYVNIFLRIPDVLLLLLMCYVVFGKSHISGMLVCIFTFSLNFAAYIAEMLESGVAAVPEGQGNAALALGFTKAESFFNIVLPQVIRVELPVFKSQVIVLVLETSISGYIAVEDLTKMSDIIRANTFEALVPMLISGVIYFAATLLISVAIGRIEMKLDPSHRRRLPKWVGQLR